MGKLREQLDVVSDFQPDIVFLLVGTNDLYNDSVATTAQKIVDLTDTLRTFDLLSCHVRSFSTETEICINLLFWCRLSVCFIIRVIYILLDDI